MAKHANVSSSDNNYNNEMAEKLLFKFKNFNKIISYLTCNAKRAFTPLK